MWFKEENNDIVIREVGWWIHVERRIEWNGIRKLIFEKDVSFVNVGKRMIEIGIILFF